MKEPSKFPSKPSSIEPANAATQRLHHYMAAKCQLTLCCQRLRKSPYVEFQAQKAIHRVCPRACADFACPQKYSHSHCDIPVVTCRLCPLLPRCTPLDPSPPALIRCENRTRPTIGGAPKRRAADAAAAVLQLRDSHKRLGTAARRNISVLSATSTTCMNSNDSNTTSNTQLETLS